MIDLGSFCLEDKVDENSKEVTVNEKLNHHMRLQFFPKFSSINSLVLDHFPNEQLLNAALRMIGNLSVKRLEIRSDHAYEDVNVPFPWVLWKKHLLNTVCRISIPDLVRKYGIQQVYVDGNSLWSPIDFNDDLVRDIVKLNASFHMFRSDNDALRDEEYWNPKKTIYANEGISFQMDVQEENNNYNMLCPKTVNIHVSIMSFEQRKRSIVFEPLYSP